MTSVAASKLADISVKSSPLFDTQINSSRLVAGVPGQGFLIREASAGIKKIGEFTMGKLLQEAAKRGIPAITKNYIITRAVQSIEHLTAAQMQDPLLVTSLILGARIGGHTIGKLAIGAGISTASISASIAAAKQTGSFEIPDKRNSFLELALSFVGLDTERGNTVDEAKMIKFNKLYKQYLPQFERAEQDWGIENSRKNQEPILTKQKKRMGGSQDGVQPFPEKISFSDGTVSKIVPYKRNGISRGERKKVEPECKMITTEIHSITARQGIFKNDRAIQEPVAVSTLTLHSILITNIPNSKLMLDLYVSGTDEKVNRASQTQNLPWSKSVESKVTGTKTLAREALAPNIIKRERTNFKRKVSEGVMTLKSHRYGACFVQGREYQPTEFMIKQEFVNGKLQPFHKD